MWPVYTCKSRPISRWFPIEWLNCSDVQLRTAATPASFNQSPAPLGADPTGHVFRAFIVLVIALVGFGIVLYRASNAQFRSARPYKHSEEQTSQRGFESCMLFLKWRPKYAVNSSRLFTYEIPGPKDRTRTKATK